MADPKVKILIEAINKAGKAFGEVKKDVSGLTGTIAKNKAAIRGAGAALTAFGAAGVMALTKVAKSFMGFEKEVRRIGVISGATKEEMAAMGNVIKDLAITTEFAIGPVGEAARIFAMAGFEMKGSADSAALLKGALDLSTAAMTDTKTATELTILAVNAWRMSAKDASLATNAFAGAVTSANVTAYDLIESLKYIATPAADFGATLAEVNSALGVLGDRMIKGTLAGTALRRMFIELDLLVAEYSGKMGDAELATRTLETRDKALRAEKTLLTYEIAKATKEFGAESDIVTDLTKQLDDLDLEQKELNADVAKFEVEKFALLDEVMAVLGPRLVKAKDSSTPFLETLKVIDETMTEMGYTAEEQTVIVEALFGARAISSAKALIGNTEEIEEKMMKIRPAMVRGLALDLMKSGVVISEDLGGAIDQIRGAWDGTEEGAKRVQVQFGLTDEQMKLLNDTILTSDEEYQGFAAAVNEAVSAGEIQSDLLDTTAGRMDYLKGTLSAAAVEYGEKLGPAIRKVADALSNLVQWFINLDPKTKNMIVKGALVATVVAAIGGPLLILISLLPSLVAGIGLVTGAMSALLGPIGLAILLIAALAVAWHKNLFDIQGKTATFVEVIKTLWTGLKTATIKTINFIIGGVEGYANSFIRAINLMIRAYNLFASTLMLPTIGTLAKITLPRVEMPSLQTYGSEAKYITRSGPAYVHEGETVSRGGSSETHIHVYLDGDEVSDVIGERTVTKMLRRYGTLGGTA